MDLPKVSTFIHSFIHSFSLRACIHSISSWLKSSATSSSRSGKSQNFFRNCFFIVLITRGFLHGHTGSSTQLGLTWAVAINIIVVSSGPRCTTGPWVLTPPETLTPSRYASGKVNCVWIVSSQMPATPPTCMSFSITQASRQTWNPRRW